MITQEEAEKISSNHLGFFGNFLKSHDSCPSLPHTEVTVLHSNLISRLSLAVRCTHRIAIEFVTIWINIVARGSLH